MERIALLVAYDGSGYSGWQIQPNAKSVQEGLESALARILPQPVRTIAAGRTDAGVHARGQVVHFDCAEGIPVDKYPIALNSILPKDVRVLEARRVSGDFHARYRAVGREYRYYLYPSKTVPPWYRETCVGVEGGLDIAGLNRYARCVVGERDFTTFAAAGDQNTNKIRTVYGAAFLIQGPFIEFRISANAFLWKMVRSIVGTILFMTARNRPVSEFRTVVASGDRSLAGPTAAPHGLFLHEVYYREQLFR